MAIFFLLLFYNHNNQNPVKRLVLTSILKPVLNPSCFKQFRLAVSNGLNRIFVRFSDQWKLAISGCLKTGLVQFLDTYGMSETCKKRLEMLKWAKNRKKKVFLLIKISISENLCFKLGLNAAYFGWFLLRNRFCLFVFFDLSCFVFYRIAFS